MNLNENKTKINETPIFKQKNETEEKEKQNIMEIQQ